MTDNNSIKIYDTDTWNKMYKINDYGNHFRWNSTDEKLLASANSNGIIHQIGQKI